MSPRAQAVRLIRAPVARRRSMLAALLWSWRRVAHVPLAIQTLIYAERLDLLGRRTPSKPQKQNRSAA